MYLKLDLTVDPRNFKSGATEVAKKVRPAWDVNKLQFKVFTDGFTNKLIGVYTDDFNKLILLRIFGAKTEEFIDRDMELHYMMLLHEHGFCPPVFAKFNNGLCYGFVPGRCLTTETVRSDPIYKLIAAKMAELHSLQVKDDKPRKAQIFQKCHDWLKLIPENFDDIEKNKRYQECIPSKAELASELSELEQHLVAIGSPIVLSHNDILINNVVYNEAENSVAFIDYEYCMYNYQAFDIGDHFDEYAGLENIDFSLYPEKDFQLLWLREYLTHWFRYNGKDPSSVTDKDVEVLYVQTNKCAVAAHFFWGIWAIIQAEKSLFDFDYLGYAIARLNEYFSTKKKFFPLKVPT